MTARWRTGTRAERIALLVATRRRDPEAGRALLASTFASESAADRAELLGALVVGLSPADEPMLEAALDDRARGVRAVAARLLDGLRGSARAQRLAARAAACLAVAGKGRRAELAVTPPTKLDDATRRDGIDDAKPGGTTLRRWWLIQMIGGAPLSVWPEHLGLDVDRIAALAVDHDEVYEGLQRAALAQHDHAWTVALFTHWPSAELLDGLAPDAASAALLGVIDTLDEQALALRLRRVGAPWSRALSDAVVARWSQRGARLLAWAIPDEAATRLDTATLDAVEHWRDTVPEQTQLLARIRALHHALALRRTIAEELPAA